MLTTYNNPTDWASLLERPLFETEALEAKVTEMLQAVRTEGDAAVRRCTTQFDGVELQQIGLPQAAIDSAAAELPPRLRQAIDQAYQNIRAFHATQRQAVQRAETMPGVTCWRKSVPIERVGLYVPAGTAPLFSSVLMLGVPAQLAGCQTLVLCTPPQKDGSIHPAMRYAAALVGCRQIFTIGGVQAVGAMAYGTESVPKVYKIFGPGIQYVTRAKQLVSQGQTAIDMPAGPSELLVWADGAANPDFVAIDLLSQAEHGRDSQVVLVTESAALVQAVERALELQLADLPRADFARGALANSLAVVLETEVQQAAFVNAYAPEHLIINTANAEAQAELVVNAGSVFLGAYTPESLGDYASGTNHTLPTNGYARQYSGVSLDDFVKKITFQRATREGLQTIGWVVEEMATAEQLTANQRAVRLRLATMHQPV